MNLTPFFDGTCRASGPGVAQGDPVGDATGLRRAEDNRCPSGKMARERRFRAHVMFARRHEEDGIADRIAGCRARRWVSRFSVGFYWVITERRWESRSGVPRSGKKVGVPVFPGLPSCKLSQKFICSAI